MYQSMQSILEYNGDDFEDVFMLTHQISFNDTFGSVVNFNIIENGNEIPVTKQNRHTFVQLYTDFILNTSIQDKFIAFRRGFMSVYRDSPLLKWYLPEELETLLCGSKVCLTIKIGSNGYFHALYFYWRSSIGSHWQVRQIMMAVSRRIMSLSSIVFLL